MEAEIVRHQHGVFSPLGGSGSLAGGNTRLGRVGLSHAIGDNRGIYSDRPDDSDDIVQYRGQ